MVSFGDYLETAQDYSLRAAIEKSFQRFHDGGYTTIYWRLLWEGHLTITMRPSALTA